MAVSVKEMLCIREENAPAELSLKVSPLLRH